MAVIKTDHVYASIGVIVLSALGFAFFSFALFSSGLLFHTYKTYQIFMSESVSGLSLESVVEYNGVEVGAVKQISIYQPNPHLVKVLLSIDKKTFISNATVATLKTRGLTGQMFISLENKGKAKASIHTKPGEHYPVIPTEPSLYTQLDTIVTHLDYELTDMKQSVQAILNKDDLETLRETYNSTHTVFSTFRDNQNNISILMDNTHDLGAKFKPLLRYKSSIVGLIEQQLSPSITKLWTNFDLIYMTLTDTFKEVKNHPSSIILGTAPSQSGPGESKVSKHAKYLHRGDHKYKVTLD